MSFVDTYEYDIFSTVMVIICAVLASIILFYHTIIDCRAKKQEQTNTKAKILNYVLRFCIIGATLSNITSCFFHFGIETTNGTIHVSCYPLFIVNTLIYGMNKANIYFSYFLRLDVSFEGSSFQVNKCLLRVLYIITGLYFMGYIFNIPFTDKRDFTWNYEYNVCERRSSNFQSLTGLILAMGIIAYECIISITTLILFLKPLFYLNRVQNDRDLHNLIIKVALLNGIIIISSITGLIWFSITGSGITINMDNVINSLCIILMVNVHERLYRKLCHFCISCRWFKFNDTIQTMNEINIRDANGTSTVSAADVTL